MIYEIPRKDSAWVLTHSGSHVLGTNKESLIWVVLVNGAPYINEWAVGQFQSIWPIAHPRLTNGAVGGWFRTIPLLVILMASSRPCLVGAFCASVVSNPLLLLYCLRPWMSTVACYQLSLEEFTRQLVQLGTWSSLLKFNSWCLNLREQCPKYWGLIAKFTDHCRWILGYYRQILGSWP
jgi:hypothetical protein